MGKTILTPNQRRILEYAAADPVIVQKFYLTGGTALSEFYLQHRLSEDLDFFTEQKIDEAMLTKWIQDTARDVSAEATFQTLREQLVYYFHFPTDIVKVDFAYFPFSPLGTFSHFKRFAAVVDATDQPRFLGNTDWNTIEKFFIAQSKELEKQILV